MTNNSKDTKPTELSTNGELTDHELNTVSGGEVTLLGLMK